MYNPNHDKFKPETKMKGLNMLRCLSMEKTTMIDDEFGSLENLYKKIFELHEEDFKLYKSKTYGYLARLEQIRNDLYEIEDRLNEMGIDGFNIVSTISNDQEELMLSKKVLNLDSIERVPGSNPSKQLKLKRTAEHA